MDLDALLHIRTACKGLLLLAALSISLRSQSSTEQDLTTLSLEELMNVKVVSASRHQENADAAPSAVTIITAEEITRYGWRTLADVLQSVRGFYINSDRMYSYVGVRGFARPGDQNWRILLLINGHRMNDSIFNAAMIGTEFPLDIDLIDRIEIVRGPSSSSYGTNAFFGVINVITRRAKSASSKAQVEASGDTESNLTRNGRVTFSGEHNQTSGMISATAYRSAGNESLFYPQYAPPATNNGYAVGVDGTSLANSFADLQVGDFRFQGLGGSRTKTVPTGEFGTSFDDPATRVTDTRAYFDASYHHKTDHETEIDSRVYYDNYLYHGTYAFTPGPQPVLGYDEAHGEWTGAELTIGQQIGKHRITAGTEYQYSLRLDQENHYIDGPELLNAHHNPASAGAYAQAELALLPVLALNAGARYDWFGTFGSTLNPRIALVYTPNRKTSFRYVFGRAFRAPTAFELYHSDGVTLVANPYLKPETIQSHEVIFERDLVRWIHFTGDGYYNSMQNLIDERPDPVSGLMHFVNVDRYNGRGLEAELQARRTSGFMAGASYSLADGQDAVLHVRLANAPLHLAKVNVSAPVTRKIVTGAELQYTSPQRSFQSTRVPDSLLANLTLTTKPIWGGFEFAASCYNVFNRRIFDPAGPGLLQPMILQDGRAFRFKITRRLAAKKTGQEATFND